MNKYLLLLLIAFGNISYADVNLELKQAAEAIKSQLPIQNGSDKKIVDVTVSDKQLTYWVQIEKNETPFKAEEFKREMKPQILEELCSNPSVSYFKENNITLVYSYINNYYTPLTYIKIIVNQEC